MEFLKFIKDYPSISALGISLISGGFGFIFKYFIDNRNFKKELKAFLWKEKINSAKKASEFYIQEISNIVLMIEMLRLIENNGYLTDETRENYKKAHERLVNFPHFEHHHINVFYNFGEFNDSEILKRTLYLIGEIDRCIIGNNNEDIVPKIRELRLNYENLINILNSRISVIRNDITNIIE